MSGGDETNKEFKEQLRMQELYAQRKADDSDPYTYTDPEDGTVYDWDHDKKAWFPKVRVSLLELYLLFSLANTRYPPLKISDVGGT